MSDGPHKSLPLRPKYKRVAEWAYKPAFTLDNVCQAAEAALLRDAAIELRNIVGRLMSIVDGSDLLARQAELQQQRLRELRDSPSVHPLAASAIECAQMAIHQGIEGRRVVEDAIATALAERFAANARATEEHYLAERGQRGGQVIRERMSLVTDQMSGDGSFARIARAVMGDATANVTRTPSQHDGLDDGVPLP